MFFFLHLIMHVTFGPIVLSCFTLICFFRFYLLSLLFGYGRLGSLLLFGCVGYKFGESLSKALLLAKRFAFLKECLFKGRNLLYQSIYWSKSLLLSSRNPLICSFNNSMISSFSWHKDIKNQRIGQINRMISLAQISNNQNVELDPKTLSQPYRL